MTVLETIQAAVDEYVAARVAEQQATDEAKYQGLATEHARLVVDYGKVLADFNAYKASHPDVVIPPPPPTDPPVTTGTAFGISTHTNFLNSIYAKDPQKTLDLTVACGASYVRDLLAYVFDQDTLWRKYRAAGIKGFHATVGQYGKANDKAKIIARLKQSADLLVEVTGFNEPDTSSTTIGAWKAEVVAWQQWLYPTVKAINPNIKVGLGALRGENKNGAAELQELMAACAGFFDFVDVHCYPGPKTEAQIKADIDAHLAWAKGAPYVVISEYGGSTFNMDADTQARVIGTGVPYIASKSKAPYASVYVYELWDDAGTGLQDLFGIYKNDGTPKSAVAVLAKLKG